MHQPLLKKLLWICAGMFAFSFALVPLYSVLCKVTGINGKTSPVAAVASTQVDAKRQVGVEFLAIVDQSIPWQFAPVTERVSVQPGTVTEVDFRVENPTDEAIVGQAIPSVSPGPAAQYLKKIECFCFTQQPLAAHESKLMRLRFYVDPALPKELQTLTLSYTLYRVKAEP